MPSSTQALGHAPPPRAGRGGRPSAVQDDRIDLLGDRGRGQPSASRPGPGVDLDTIIGPLFGRMARVSRRILRDDGLAEDAIQETLLSFWARGELPANPQAWLLHAVTLRSLHLARTSRRRRDRERRACLGRPEGSLGDDPARSLDHDDLRRILDESLLSLPDESRAVFLLWAIDELDYAAIADALQIPIGTVRSRLSRARRSIRESLARRLSGPNPRTGPHLARPEGTSRGDSLFDRRGGTGG